MQFYSIMSLKSTFRSKLCTRSKGVSSILHSSTASASTAVERKNHEIPASLLDEITLLTTKTSGSRIYLIGTAHVSKKSAISVRELIKLIKPKGVFLELCDTRMTKFETEAEETDLTYMQSAKILLKGEQNLFSFLYSRFLRNVSKDLGTRPGDEFRVGNEEAKLCQASVIPGDRDVMITLKRIWLGMTLFEKLKLALFFISPSTTSTNIGTDIEDLKMKGSKILENTIRETGQEFPWGLECLVNERDLYMVSTLQKALFDLEKQELGDVDMVAVVGAGHIPGMIQIWENEMNNPGSEITIEKIRILSLQPRLKPDDLNYISDQDFR
jgi:pheromone shutdown protein TraB